MKSLGSDKSAAKAEKSNSTEAAAASDGNNNGFFTANDKIDFSNVKVEPLFEEEVDFDTFSKSDFRAVKVKECVAYDVCYTDSSKVRKRICRYRERKC